MSVAMGVWRGEFANSWAPRQGFNAPPGDFGYNKHIAPQIYTHSHNFTDSLSPLSDSHPRRRSALLSREHVVAYTHALFRCTANVRAANLVRKRRKSAGKRRGSCFPRDLWGRTASARDTTTTHYGSHRRRAGGEPVKTTTGSPGRPGSPGVALGGPRQASNGEGEGRGTGKPWGAGKPAGKGSGELT